MIRTRLVPLLVLLPVLALASQTPKPSDTHPPGRNPHLGDAASIKSGLALYRVRCGDCHGVSCCSAPT